MYVNSGAANDAPTVFARLLLLPHIDLISPKTQRAILDFQPWKQLHPDGSVTNLMDALNEKYDGYYENSFNVAKVGWQQCFTGLSHKHSSTLYDLANEHPLWLNETIRTLVRSDGRRQSEAFCGRWGWLLAWLGLMAVVGY